MVHKDSVCVVKWSPNASRIVSADLSGLVGVWKLASQVCKHLLKRTPGSNQFNWHQRESSFLANYWSESTL